MADPFFQRPSSAKQMGQSASVVDFSVPTLIVKSCDGPRSFVDSSISAALQVPEEDYTNKPALGGRGRRTLLDILEAFLEHVQDPRCTLDNGQYTVVCKYLVLS